MPAPAPSRCLSHALGSIPFNRNDPPDDGATVYRYPDAIADGLRRAGVLLATGGLTDAGLEDFIRYAIRPVPRRLRGDTAAAMIRSAGYWRDREYAEQDRAETAVLDFVRDALLWQRPREQVLDGALAFGAAALGEAHVLGLLHGCAVEHAERLKRLQPWQERTRR